MKSKQPLYTALGWATWTLGKRALKRKLRGSDDRRGGRLKKLALTLIVLGGAGAGAYAMTQGSSTDA